MVLFLKRFLLRIDEFVHAPLIITNTCSGAGPASVQINQVESSVLHKLSLLPSFKEAAMDSHQKMPTTSGAGKVWPDLSTLDEELAALISERVIASLLVDESL